MKDKLREDHVRAQGYAMERAIEAGKRKDFTGVSKAVEVFNHHGKAMGIGTPEKK